MSESHIFTPATIWRAFFVCIFLSSMAYGASKGPPASPPELAQIGKPDEAEARQLIALVREAGLPTGAFCELELQALPRRGATVVFRGRLWTGRNDLGSVIRVELEDSTGKMRRLLVQKGENPGVWRFTTGGTVEQVDTAALFDPVIPGAELTAFDLLQPFLYWRDASLDKLARIRGRPAYAFVFRAPTDAVASLQGVVAARVYLDTQFNAIMQTELLGPGNRVLKTTSLVDLKRITDPQTREQKWFPKSLDVRNDVTRDKTRFRIKAVALDLQLLPAVFDPASLAQPVQPPAAGRLVRLEP